MSRTIESSSPRSWRRWLASPRPPLRWFAVVLAVAAAGGLAEGYVRIVINDKQLHWTSATQPWLLHQAGSDNIDDGSELAAIQHGFKAWQEVTGSKLKFVFQGATGSRNLGSDDHLVVFDEDNSSGYFPPGSGVVAVTPISYYPPTGAILDADIAFNGRDWTFSTDRSPGSFDVQDVVTHEIGHFVGLDHSPVLASSMWPYVSTTQWLHRSLSGDDQAGAIAVDPGGGDGRLHGSLRKADGSLLKGAMVVAVRADDGRLAASVASGPDGDWSLRGLPTGDYHVYVAPLEGGMTQANLSGNSPVQTGFGAEFYGGYGTPTLFAVTQGETAATGTLTLPPDSALLDSTGTSVLLQPGQTRVVSLWGSGFSAGAMSAWTLSPYLSIGSVNSGSTWMQVQVTAQAGAPLGLYDLYLANPAEQMEAVSGVLEVHGPAPLLAGLDVALGPVEGGTVVMLSGANFGNGAYVLFGGREAAAEVLDANTILATTPPGSSGTVEVAVHNSDGQQVRLADAFTYASVPAFLRLFPAAGQTPGGTTLVIGGTGFAPEIVVALDGEELPVTWLSPNVVEVTTPSHAAGAVDLLLRNPQGPDVIVAEAFSFVAQPDPRITGFTPTRARDGGGVKVRIDGANLSGALAVRFGVDPVTAEGGREAHGLTTLGPNALEAVAPAWRPGSYGIQVVMPNGQAGVAPATFQYLPEAQSGAAGCGGVVESGGARAGATDLSALVLVGLGFALLRRRPAA